MNKYAQDLDEIVLPDFELMELFHKEARPLFQSSKSDYFIAAPSLEDEFDDDLDFLPEEDIDDLLDDDGFEEGYGFVTNKESDEATYNSPEPDAQSYQETLAKVEEAETSHVKENNESEEDGHVKEGNLLLGLKGITKQYKQGGKTLNILNGVDLRISAGEITALVGPSGSGKSTLLHILGLLDTPTSGQVIIGGRDVTKASDLVRTELRGEYIGFVYQFHHLLPEFTAQENVAMPQIIAGKAPVQANKKAVELLAQLGLEHRIKHRPATLSGGEQQRVAIARALANDPYLLFADEPTGNLDPETSDEVFEILMEQVHSRGIGALIATHNIDLANQMDRILEMKAGRVLPY